MGKLTGLAPRLKPLATRVPYLQGAADSGEPGARQARRSGHQWYSLTKWRRLRWATLLRDHFTCQMCGHLEGNTSQLVADHKEAHRGNEARFFDPNNLWTLCKPCHDGPKQRQEITGMAD